MRGEDPRQLVDEGAVGMVLRNTTAIAESQPAEPTATGGLCSLLRDASESAVARKRSRSIWANIPRSPEWATSDSFSSRMILDVKDVIRLGDLLLRRAVILCFFIGN